MNKIYSYYQLRQEVPGDQKPPSKSIMRLRNGNAPPHLNDKKEIMIAWDWLYPRLKYPKTPKNFNGLLVISSKEDLYAKEFHKIIFAIDAHPKLEMKSDEQLSKYLTQLGGYIDTDLHWKEDYLPGSKAKDNHMDPIFSVDQNFDIENEHTKKDDDIQFPTFNRTASGWIYMDAALGQTRQEAKANGIKKIEDKLLRKE